MITHGGGGFSLLDPKPEDVRLTDIAHSLSQQCRYGGHTSRFYSVAEHSVRLSWRAEEMGLDLTARQVALLHDAEEAYIRDIPAPQIAIGLPGGDVAHINALGAVIRSVIFEAVGLPLELAHYQLRLPLIHELDIRIRADEVLALFQPSCAWAVADLEPLGVFSADSAGWEAVVAREAFLSTARRLGLSA